MNNFYSKNVKLLTKKLVPYNEYFSFLFFFVNILYSIQFHILYITVTILTQSTFIVHLILYFWTVGCDLECVKVFTEQLQYSFDKGICVMNMSYESHVMVIHFEWSQFDGHSSQFLSYFLARCCKDCMKIPV